MYRFTRSDIPLYQYILSTYNIIDNRCNINILVKWYICSVYILYIYIAYYRVSTTHRECIANGFLASK